LYTLVIPTLGRQRQEDSILEFEAILDYVVRPWLKKKKKKVVNVKTVHEVVYKSYLPAS
jgi:hypothetical protein